MNGRDPVTNEILAGEFPGVQASRDCWRLEAQGRHCCHTFTHSSPFFPFADAGKFPGGLSALADYIHSKGLKFGLYSAASSVVCSGRVGSLYHEALDAGTFAKAGVDFIKCARRGVGGQWRQKRGCG